MKLHNLFHWIFPCTHRWFGCVAQRTQSKMWDTKNERARKTVINSSCFGASTSIFVRIKERECTHTHTHMNLLSVCDAATVRCRYSVVVSFVRHFFVLHSAMSADSMALLVEILKIGPVRASRTWRTHSISIVVDVQSAIRFRATVHWMTKTHFTGKTLSIPAPATHLHRPHTIAIFHFQNENRILIVKHCASLQCMHPSSDSVRESHSKLSNWHSTDWTGTAFHKVAHQPIWLSAVYFWQF